LWEFETRRRLMERLKESIERVVDVEKRRQRSAQELKNEGAEPCLGISGEGDADHPRATAEMRRTISAQGELIADMGKLIVDMKRISEDLRDHFCSAFLRSLETERREGAAVDFEDMS
jgi:hypothetical protein